MTVEPRRGDYLRFVRKNRWDSHHLRSHISDVGEVTMFVRAGTPRQANQVRLRFQCKTRNVCAEWVAVRRCDDE